MQQLVALAYVLCLLSLHSEKLSDLPVLLGNSPCQLLVSAQLLQALLPASASAMLCLPDSPLQARLLLTKHLFVMVPVVLPSCTCCGLELSLLICSTRHCQQCFCCNVQIDVQHPLGSLLLCAIQAWAEHMLATLSISCVQAIA